ncbi:glycosyltransferase family 2 protein [Flavihumibacter sp. UBA7668]|uniref:glycosyltransferase family 2 protein n=1 Tax=Flavihumibacter sp. UBA7668 TaxID=1946542 RepID=UPI0025C70979|nr:glycosyltransferase family A protein [Flavihumibacter sp. UBA7668]
MLVSVIIPCYNVVDYIEECLQSVYNQDYSSLEVICVDNNSSDSTLKKLNQLKTDRYKELIILEEPKKGANAARNKGLQHARGEWIQFLDADDLLLPDKISSQIRQISLNGFSGFIAATAIRNKINGEQMLYELYQEQPAIAVFTGRAGTTCSNLWEKKWLDKINGWDESIQSSQEADLMLRLVLADCPIQFDSTPLTLLRDRETGQISQTDPSKRWIQLLHTRLHFIREFRKKQPAAYKQQKNMFCTYLLSSLLVLARYNRKKALEYYNLLDFSGWKPQAGFGISKSKAILLQYLGFSLFTKLNLIRQDQ